MTDNPIAEAIAGIVTGLVTEALFIALAEAFSKIGAPPLYTFLLIIVILIGFLSGIAEAYTAGILYCLSLIYFGNLLGDPSSIITGLVSLVGMGASFVIKSGMIDG